MGEERINKCPNYIKTSMILITYYNTSNYFFKALTIYIDEKKQQ